MPLNIWQLLKKVSPQMQVRNYGDGHLRTILELLSGIEPCMIGFTWWFRIKISGFLFWHWNCTWPTFGLNISQLYVHKMTKKWTWRDCPGSQDSYPTDPLIRRAIFHYQLEAIHPFSDGNSRTDRIMNLLHLVNQMETTPFGPGWLWISASRWYEIIGEKIVDMSD